MFTIKRVLASGLAVSLVAAGVIATGAPAAWAATGPPQPHDPDEGGIGFPIFALIGVAAVATIAIWQGINDSKKKKQAEAEKEKELEETGEYEEYFEFSAEEAAEGESRAAETEAEGAEVTTAHAAAAE
jgi:hypothetical protein